MFYNFVENRTKRKLQATYQLIKYGKLNKKIKLSLTLDTEK